MAARFVEYVKGDAFRVKVRLGDTMGEGIQEIPGAAWTLEDEDGNALMCFGISNPEHGISTLWSYISDDARGHGLQIVKFARPRIAAAMKALELRRLQAIVRADKPEYERFIKLFGFEFEGRIRRVTTDNKDVLMFSRIE